MISDTSPLKEALKTVNFEDARGWCYLMTSDLELFKVVVPFEVAREMWSRRKPDTPLSAGDLRAWMACSTLLFLPRIAKRVSPTSHPRNIDDDRIEVIPIPKSSTLYKGALADRGSVELDKKISEPEFAPGVRFMFGAEETAELKRSAAMSARVCRNQTRGRGQ